MRNRGRCESRMWRWRPSRNIWRPVSGALLQELGVHCKRFFGAARTVALQAAAVSGGHI